MTKLRPLTAKLARGVSCLLLAAAIFSTADQQALASDFGDLFVGNAVTQSVSEYTASGNFVRTFIPPESSGQQLSYGMSFGPDGNLYIPGPSTVQKFNGATGAFMGDIVNGYGGADIAFDPSGHFYLSNPGQNQIEMFDRNGNLIRIFSEGVSSPTGLVWDPLHSQLLVTNQYSGPYVQTITAINTSTGSWSTFATGLGEAEIIVRGQTGNYYVSNAAYINDNPNTIQEIGADGGASSTIVGPGVLNDPISMAESSGYLYVGNFLGNAVDVFNEQTGTLVNSFYAQSPIAMTFMDVPDTSTPEPGLPALMFAAVLAIGVVAVSRRIRNRDLICRRSYLSSVLLAVKCTSILVIVTAGVLTAKRAGAQNLFTNGSFEYGAYSGGADGMDLLPGSTALTGWTIVTSDIAWFDNANSHGFVASDGTKSLDLTGTSDSVPQAAITQTIVTGDQGVYSVSFDVGAQLQSRGSAVLATVKDANTSETLFSKMYSGSTSSLTSVWFHESFDFTAVGKASIVTFAADYPGSISIGLDNVVGSVIDAPVQFTPEPGAGVITIASLPAVLWLLKRKRASRLN